MLCNGVIVQSGSCADGDLGGIEAGAENIIGACSKRLDPPQLRQTLGLLLESRHRVRPGYEDLGVEEIVRNGLFYIVGVERDAEALEQAGVNFERGRVEEFGSHLLIVCAEWGEENSQV